MPESANQLFIDGQYKAALIKPHTINGHYKSAHLIFYSCSRRLIRTYTAVLFMWKQQIWPLFDAGVPQLK